MIFYQSEALRGDGEARRGPDMKATETEGTAVVVAGECSPPFHGLLLPSKHTQTGMGSEDAWYSRVLPFATAPTVVRAHQKDEQAVAELERRLGELVKRARGARFVHTHGAAVRTAAKLAYYAVTTAVGARTLGEEYVDVSYVDRTGRRRVGAARRVLFVLAYVLFPVVLSRLLRLLGKEQEEGEEGEEGSWLGRLRALLARTGAAGVADATNLHLALFYATGRYYTLAKRALGLRYVLNYTPGRESRAGGQGNYEVLGALMALQLLLRYVGLVRSVVGGGGKAVMADKRPVGGGGCGRGVFYMPEREDDRDAEPAAAAAATAAGTIDLADPAALPYVPPQSRACLLCLEPLRRPAAAGCGHVFCWACVHAWCRERSDASAAGPECPLCRAPLRAAQLLPLR